MSTKRLHILILMIVCASLSTNATTSCYLPDVGQPAVIFTISGASNVGEAEFSISETKKIHFCKGNLLYQPSTKKWKIAPRQYDFVGGNNTKKDVPYGVHGTVYENGVRCSNTTGNHRKDYTGWLDVFAWGTSGWYGDDPGEDRTESYEWRLVNNPNQKVTCNPYDLPNKNNVCLTLDGDDYQGLTGNYALADWGIRNNIELGGSTDSVFRTPTKEEFDYLITGRGNAASLRARGHIKLLGNNGAPDTLVNGLILLPDEWDPAILPETPIISDAEGNEYYDNNEFTAAEWQILEENGAIFLPATGNTSKFNRSGYYWTSTAWRNGSAWDLEFGGYGWSGRDSDPQTKGATRESGRAVRLVMEISTSTPETPEPPVVTTTCDDYAKVDVPGTGGTITSTQDELDHCIWNLTATPNEGYEFAYWIDLSGHKTYTETTDIYIYAPIKSVAMQAVFIKSSAYIHEWEADSIVYRSDTTNLLHGSNRGYGALAIDNDVVSDYVFKSDEGIWKQKISPDLAGNIYAGKNVHLVLFDECDKPSAVFDAIMPVMIYGDSLASNVDFHSDAQTDVTVSDGATLTINTNKTIQGFLNIQAGGKVIVNEGAELSVGGIIMRGNGITKKWPQLVVQGHINNNNENTIYYDYTLDQHAYYPLAFPYNVTCSEVYHLISKKKTGYQAFTFDTDARADGGNGWVMFDDTVEPIFEAGKGYIIYASPTKWNGNRQQSAVIRFPMEADLHETAEANVNKSTPTTYTTPDPASRQDMEVLNWNLIGNPYLANFKVGSNTADTNKIVQGYLEWNEEEGKYDLIRPGSDEKAALRYITYSNDGYRSYEQQRIRDFVLKPFNSYFVQTSAGDGIMFSKDDFAATPAPRRTQGNDVIEELETGILLTQGNRTEQIGLLFGDYTYDYELNADLLKEIGEAQPMSAYSLQGSTPLAFQALPAEAMARPILLGYRKAQSGLMTFSFDDSQYDRNLLDGLWLTDIFTGQVTNLLVEDYTFTPESAQDDNRFYLSCERRKVVDVTTNAEETTQQRTIIRVFDMFGREMHGDVNALPQGVYILMDNLGNTSKEILGQ